ncbi:phosphopentomutase [Oscillospiraceae bacterium MB08-C2-2]|nr:phosphopentomutase [Oscillospiraceae bacterium MB08-C2-2]
MKKRVFVIVLDSFGVGALPDAEQYGDEGSDTLAAVAGHAAFCAPNLQKLGLFNIEGVTAGQAAVEPQASFARMAEASKGKDTTIGHWEIAGVVSPKPLPTYPGGFPPKILNLLREKTGHEYICNRPYSGTQLLAEYGKEHMETGALLLYTSADSVLQIAAHTDVVPLEELYRCCGIAREIMTGEHGVGRIIARPFRGEYPNFLRTADRHDYSLEPPAFTLLDHLNQAGLDTVAVGKIFDIFAGRGISRALRTRNNTEGMRQATAMAQQEFHGLCFVNLVDFDMQYGHRNDTEGYARAISQFDSQLVPFMKELYRDDLAIITADHGCDPSTPSTDHSREYVPMLAFGDTIRGGVNLGTRQSFADIAATVQEYLDLPVRTAGKSFLAEILK